MNNQQRVDFWKSKFQVLNDWNIQYVDDGENYSRSIYNLKIKRMVIFPCDIDIEDDWILHEILKISLIVGNISVENASSVLEDLCAMIRR